MEHFFILGFNDASIGLVGLELYGRDALLRSLVVAWQRQEKRTRRARARPGRGVRLLVDNRDKHILFARRLLRYSTNAGNRIDPSHTGVCRHLSDPFGIHA